MKNILRNAILSLILFASFAFANSKNYNPESDFAFPAIISISGTELNEYEKVFIKKVKPYGILLLSKNIKSKEQLKKLRNEIETISNKKILFFIDQEGGRVDRLKEIYPKHEYPSPYYFNNIATKDLKKSKELVYKNSLQTARDLKELGVDVNLGLILDVVANKKSLEENKDTDYRKMKFDIGDRSFSNNPDIVRILAKEKIKAFNEVGVELCAKHFIGLGSSESNTHNGVSIINKNLDELKKMELVPFRDLRDVKYGLLAHAIYPALDSKNPAPFSPEVVNFIRNDLNFKGILISDALNMGALSQYPLKERIEKILNNNVDLVILMEPLQNKKQLDNLLSIVADVKSELLKNNNYSKRI